MLCKLQKIPEVFKDVLPELSHYEAFKKGDSYAVWAEDSEGSSIEADNRKGEQSIQGTLDYFTKTDKDPKVDEIQEAFKAAEISFYLESVQYEDETKYIHYEWVWEVS